MSRIEYRIDETNDMYGIRFECHVYRLSKVECDQLREFINNLKEVSVDKV